MKISSTTYVQQNTSKVAFKGNKYALLTDNFSTLDKFTENSTNKFKQYIPVLKEFISTTGKYKDTNFRSVIGQGGYSIIFDIGNDEVLKLTQENPYQYRKYIAGLDVPLFGFDEFNGFYILREAKAIIDREKINSEHLAEILNIMHKHRLEPSADFNTHRFDQIGLIDNKPYLLDSRCAVPKPNKFTEFVENFTAIHRKRKFTFYPNKDLNSMEITHIDETPRANLSLGKGLQKITSTILDNIEFYFLAMFNKKSDKFINF